LHLEQNNEKTGLQLYLHIFHLMQLLFLYNLRKFHMDQAVYFCLLLGPSSGLLDVHVTYRTELYPNTEIWIIRWCTLLYRINNSNVYVNYGFKESK
jgi:hypothetical protein